MTLLLLLQLLFVYRHHGEFLLPSTKTYGGIATTDKAKICATVWARDARHVTPKMKAEVYAEYHATKNAKCCEVDHLISRELGGADWMSNLWPQPWDQARLKDRLENRLHKLVCSGELDIRTAQREIADDWVASYLKRVGPLPK